MRTLALIVASLPLIAVAAPPAGPNLEGAWEGALKVGGIQLRVVAHIKKSGADQWSATLDSPDQGAKDIPIEQVRLEGQKLTLTLPKIMAKFEGTLAGDKVTGTWSQGMGTLPLELVKTDHPTVVGPKPQEPKPPYPYQTSDVTVEVAKAKVKLACTLSEPRGKGRFAAVALITGSGAQDRDEQLLGHKPFLVLADALTRKGIAVLRCDDRGFAKSTGDLVHATTYDFVDDALAQVAWLRARPEINPVRVGLVGHSEGGEIAPMAAAQSKDVAFIVLLAGPGLTGEEIVTLQGERIMRAEGKSDTEVKLQGDTQKKAFAILKAEKDDAAIAKKLRELWASLPEAERKKPENSETQLQIQIKTLTSPWFKAFLSLDPRTYLKQVKVPVLAVNGERDLQVPPKENLPQISAALKGNPDVTVQELPELNHLFQHCKSGAPSEYATIDETFSPGALELVGDWIVKRAK